MRCVMRIYSIKLKNYDDANSSWSILILECNQEDHKNPANLVSNAISINRELAHTCMMFSSKARTEARDTRIKEAEAAITMCLMIIGKEAGWGKEAILILEDEETGPAKIQNNHRITRIQSQIRIQIARNLKTLFLTFASFSKLENVTKAQTAKNCTSIQWTTRWSVWWSNKIFPGIPPQA